MQRQLFVIFCAVCSVAIAQQGRRETVAKPRSEKDQKKLSRKLGNELKSAYDTWEKVDVAYIITDEERQALHRLSNDEERERFIEQFWLRRDLTPDTEENEVKEEHYRRFAYANERFASGIPGWRTDRGRMYIMHGAPDEIEPHPSGGTYQRSLQAGSGQSTAFPFETWRYRYLEGVGTDVVIEFVDQTMTGEYHMTIDQSEKDALQHVPGHQTQVATSGSQLGPSQFDLLEREVNLLKPPAIKFKDLEAVVSNIRYNTFPIKVRTDFIPLTPASILTNITLQFDRETLQFQQRDGVGKATVNIYARVSTMSRRTVNVFEDVVSVETPADLLLYQKTVPLAPGRYRLNIAAKDVIGGNTTSYEAALDVPPFEENKLAASSLILADMMQRVPARSIGAGQFVIADTKVRPRVSETLQSGEKLGIYIQLYHFAPDPATHRPNGVIEYEILKDGTSQSVLSYAEELSGLDGSSSQVTVQKWLALNDLAPGSYTLRMKVVDRIRNQTIIPSARFRIAPL